MAPVVSYTTVSYLSTWVMIALTGTDSDVKIQQDTTIRKGLKRYSKFGPKGGLR
jgi:hypothetical protein